MTWALCLAFQKKSIIYYTRRQLLTTKQKTNNTPAKANEPVATHNKI